MSERLVALVTGAGSGIGRATALALAGEGASVWLVGRTLDKLHEVAHLARERGGSARVVQTDLAVDADLEALAAELPGDEGSLDVLVHSAGEITLGTIELTPVEQLDRLYRINLRAPYRLTQLLLPLLRDAKGHVVFINSSAGLSASPRIGHYAATKFALRGLADSLRLEVNADGIRVLSLFPGRVATTMQAAVHEAEGETFDPGALAQPEDVAELIVSALNLPRTAEVTDLSVRPMLKPPRRR
jgi:NADP-dependent 3-hydroxy acid dehydrogenase YdfG